MPRPRKTPPASTPKKSASRPRRQPAETIRRRAHAEKLPSRVLVAAKADAKVRSLRDGQERRWYWKRPDCWMRDGEGTMFPTMI